MERTVVQPVRGFRTKDGAGVSLVRVLGHETVETYDPLLMLDSFDSINPDDYTAGFPLHHTAASRRSVMSTAAL